MEGIEKNQAIYGVLFSAFSDFEIRSRNTPTAGTSGESRASFALYRHTAGASSGDPDYSSPMNVCREGQRLTAGFIIDSIHGTHAFSPVAAVMLCIRARLLVVPYRYSQ